MGGALCLPSEPLVAGSSLTLAAAQPIIRSFHHDAFVEPSIDPFNPSETRPYIAAAISSSAKQPKERTKLRAHNARLFAQYAKTDVKQQHLTRSELAQLVNDSLGQTLITLSETLSILYRDMAHGTESLLDSTSSSIMDRSEQRSYVNRLFIAEKQNSLIALTAVFEQCCKQVDLITDRCYARLLELSASITVGSGIGKAVFVAHWHIVGDDVLKEFTEDVKSHERPHSSGLRI